MQMSNDEIVRNYNDAKDKSKQIEILADLNCCPKSEIRDILREAGIKLAGNPNFGKPEIKKVSKANAELKAAKKEAEKLKKAAKESEEMLPEEQCKIYIPGVIRDQLMEDVKRIDDEIHELIKKKNTILDYIYASMREDLSRQQENI